MNREKLISQVKTMMTPKRFAHTLGVEQKAIELAVHNGQDPYKASLAALLHDCARDMDREQLVKNAKEYRVPLDDVTLFQIELIHGPVGAALARYHFGITDQEVLRAISIHTTGDIDMTPLEKVVYLADIIEQGRDFPGVEDLRQLAKKDLDKAVLKAMDGALTYVIKKGELIHEKTVKARNELICKIMH